MAFLIWSFIAALEVNVLLIDPRPFQTSARFHPANSARLLRHQAHPADRTTEGNPGTVTMLLNWSQTTETLHWVGRWWWHWWLWTCCCYGYRRETWSQSPRWMMTARVCVCERVWTFRRSCFTSRAGTCTTLPLSQWLTDSCFQSTGRQASHLLAFM